MGKKSPTKRFRRLAKAIKPYGYTIKVVRNSHNGIFNSEGRRVYTFAGSPAVPEYAMHNTLHDLQKMGCIPWECKL